MDYTERSKAWKNWNIGDLVFVNYKNRYYGEITAIEKHGYAGNEDHRIVTVRRLYDEFGEDTPSKGRHSYDAAYLTKVDDKYLDLQKNRYKRIVELHKQHNKGSG